jgi:hypothetical protein
MNYFGDRGKSTWKQQKGAADRVYRTVMAVGARKQTS